MCLTKDSEIVREFLETFVEDTAIRLEVETVFMDAERVDPYVSPDDLANLARVSAFYKANPSPELMYTANVAVLEMLRVYREIKGSQVKRG
jgi:hypothetical protein